MGVEINRGEQRGYGTAGIGYIVVPNNEDRDEYVKRCYRNHTVDIIPGMNYSKTFNIPITIEALERVSFPERTEDLGSTIVWVREDFQNRPVVIGVIKDGSEASQMSSNQRQIIQEYGNQIAQIFFDAKKSLINVHAVGNAGIPAVVNIKSTGSTEDEVNIESNGYFNSNSRVERHTITERYELVLNNGKKDIYKLEINDRKLNIVDQWGNSITLTELSNEITDSFGRTIILDKDNAHYKDSFENEIILNKDNVKVLCKKFNVGQGKEQMVLGNTLKSLMERLIGAIQSIKVPTPNGISGNPINTAQFSAIKSELDSFLSKLSNTD